MNALTLAALLSTAAAATHAVAAVVQERLAARIERAERGRPLSPMIARVFRRRQWWIAVALAGGASLLHIAALRHGPLTVVQPLGALTLVLALPLRAAVLRRRVGPAEWRGAFLTVAGLTGLLALTAAGRPTRALDARQVLVLTVVAAAVLGVLAVKGGAARGPVARSLSFAVAAGVAFGVSSALTQTVVVRFSRDGMLAVLSPAAVIVLMLAVGGLLLAQAAYRGGLGAPLATLTLVNPATAALIGIALLGERYAGGVPGALLAVVSAAVAAWGITVLARPEIAPERLAPATLGVR